MDWYVRGVKSARERTVRSRSSSFDNSIYYRFLDVADAAGITISIVPGIFPVQNFKQTANFARRAGTRVPHWLAERFDGLERGRSGDAPPRRGGRLRRAGDRPHRPRRRRPAFLHDEPRRSRLSDLPPHRAEGEAEGGRGRRERRCRERALPVTRGSQSKTSSQCSDPSSSPTTMRFGATATIARTGASSSMRAISTPFLTSHSRTVLS